MLLFFSPVLLAQFSDSGCHPFIINHYIVSRLLLFLSLNEDRTSQSEIIAAMPTWVCRGCIINFARRTREARFSFIDLNSQYFLEKRGTKQRLLSILTDQIEVGCTFQIDCYFCYALSEHFQTLPVSDWNQESFAQSCSRWRPPPFCSNKKYIHNNYYEVFHCQNISM